MAIRRRAFVLAAVMSTAWLAACTDSHVTATDADAGSGFADVAIPLVDTPALPDSEADSEADSGADSEADSGAGADAEADSDSARYSCVTASASISTFQIGFSSAATTTIVVTGCAFANTCPCTLPTASASAASVR